MRKILGSLLILAASSQALALIGGQADEKLQFKSAAFIVAAHACSATKISDHFFLTAAHCVNDVGDGTQNNIDFTLQPIPLPTTAIRTQLGDFQASIRRVYLHPAWHTIMKKEFTNEEIAKNVRLPAISDVALIELEEIMPIPDSELYFATLTNQNKLDLGGFGNKDESGAGQGQGFTFAEVLVLGSTLESSVFYADSLKTDKSGSALLRSGDSGGAAYVETSPGVFKAAGINSGSSTATFSNGEKREIGFLTRLDGGSPKVSEWICSVVKVPGC